MKPITRYTSYTQVTQVTKKDVTLIVLELHKQGFYQKQIAEKLKTSKRTVFYHTKKLLELGYLEEITRSNIVIYRVTEKGENAIKTKQVTKSLTGGEPPKINLHNLPIKIPILEDIEIPDAELNNGLRNVPRQFKKLPFYGLTITRIVGKNPSIMINVHPRDIKTPDEEFNVVFQAVILTNDYLSSKGMKLDLANFHAKVSEMWIHDPVAEKEANEGRFTKTFLGRVAAKKTPRDPDVEAAVWNDTTPGKGMESNDRTWMTNYQRMPDRVADMMGMIAGQIQVQELEKENIKLHLSTLRETKETMRQTKGYMKKAIKVQDKLYALLTQRRLGDFL